MPPALVLGSLLIEILVKHRVSIRLTMSEVDLLIAFVELVCELNAEESAWALVVGEVVLGVDYVFA